MGCCFSLDDNESSSDFHKRKNISPDTFDGTIKYHERECTDSCFLIFFILFMALWGGLIAYCISQGDLRRITHGYDDCGNLCGIKNVKSALNATQNPKCAARDYTDAPYMRIAPKGQWDKHEKRSCVSRCNESD